MSIQIQEFSFTPKGHAYQLDAQFKTRDGAIFLTAQKPSSTDWRDRASAIGGNTSAVEIDAEAEAKEPKELETRFILVVVVPQNHPSDDALSKGRSRDVIGVSATEEYLKPVYQGNSPSVLDDIWDINHAGRSASLLLISLALG